MSALIVFDNMGGDFSFHHVDDEMWAHIKEIYDTCDWGDRSFDGPFSKYKIQEKIGAFFHPDEPDCVQFLADNGIVPRGNVLNNYYAQKFVIENVDMKDICAILTFQSC